MKKLYILINVILIGVIGLFINLHYHYRDDHKVKVVTKTVLELPHVTKQNIKSDVLTINHASIGALFSRERTQKDVDEEDAETIRAATLPLRLTGIMRFGDKGGAMIEPVGESKFTKVGNNNKAKAKKYYRVGDTVFSGYTLTEIGDGFVKLVKGNQEATLTTEKKTHKKAEKSGLKFSVKDIE